MPTASETLSNNRHRVVRSPKPPHKRPRVPRQAELRARRNAPFANAIGLNYSGVDRGGKNLTISTDTTRESSECRGASSGTNSGDEQRRPLQINQGARSESQKQQQNLVVDDNNNETAGYDDDDDHNKLFHCMFSDGSSRILTASQLDYLQQHGTLPAEEESIISMNTQQQQHLATLTTPAGQTQGKMSSMDDQTDVQLHDRRRPAIQRALHQAPAQIQSECPRLANNKTMEQAITQQERTTVTSQNYEPRAPQIQPKRIGASAYGEKQQDNQNIHGSHYDSHEQFVERRSSGNHYTPECVKQQQQTNYNHQQSLPHGISKAWTGNCLPLEASGNQQNGFIDLNTLPNHLKWIDNIFTTKNPGVDCAVMSTNNSNTLLPSQQQQIRRNPVSLATVELSHYPRPPHDPTNQEDLKHYHQAVETFLKRQNQNYQHMLRVSNPVYQPRPQQGSPVYQPSGGFDKSVDPISRVNGSKAQGAGGVAKTLLPSSLEDPQTTAHQQRRGLLQHFISDLTGDFVKRAGCRGVLGCLTADNNKNSDA